MRFTQIFLSNWGNTQVNLWHIHVVARSCRSIIEWFTTRLAFYLSRYKDKIFIDEMHIHFVLNTSCLLTKQKWLRCKIVPSSLSSRVSSMKSLHCFLLEWYHSPSCPPSPLQTQQSPIPAKWFVDPSSVTRCFANLNVVTDAIKAALWLRCSCNNCI